MLYINKLTNDPLQTLRLTGLPGIIINMNLRFLPRMNQWQMDVAYNSFTANGMIVPTSPNLMRQWKNTIPFGIACMTASGLDPYTVNDFANQSANLYLLNAADVQVLEDEFFS